MFGGLIHRRVAARASSARVALRTPSTEITFGELDVRARRLAAALADQAATAHRIAIVSANHAVIAPALLGALSAGWAFAPLDPALTDDRLRAQLARLGCTAIVTDDPGRFAKLGMPVFTLDQLPPAPPGPDAGDPEAMSSIYFTSGSTGAPRAIAGRVAGIDHHIAWEIGFLGLDASVRGAIVHAPTYDAYLPDLLVPICAGGVACAPPRGAMSDPAAACRWLEIEQITLLHCVPSLFRTLLASPQAPRLRGLRHVLLAGELVRPDDVRAARALVGEHARLINLYGPTEATLVKLHHEIVDSDVDEIPIGVPMPGVSVQLLDDDGRPCAPGSVGQIAIRSRYGSLGYLDEPELTRAKFLDAASGEQIYLTGDRGQLREDGSLLFRGRRDRQIKLLGARVDLDEVEAIVGTCPGVIEVVVVADATATVLHGAIVLDGGATLSTIRGEVMQRLAPAMRLARLRAVDVLPRTASGKLDRWRVAEMFEAAG